MTKFDTLYESFMKEDKINEDDYKFYVINNKNQIIFGWEYKEDAKDSLEDYPNKPEFKGLKIYTLSHLKSNNIDPTDDKNWYK